MGSLPRSNTPCAACKFLRRRCVEDCILSPYFPAADIDKFVAVHRVFGASNITKMLQEIPIKDREDAITSIVYEANARLKDPVYGCVGFLASLQSQVLHLQSELKTAVAEVSLLRTQLSDALSMVDYIQNTRSTENNEINSHHHHRHRHHLQQQQPRGNHITISDEMPIFSQAIDFSKPWY